MKANEFTLTVHPVSDEDTQGRCEIILTQKADGKVFFKDKWICPTAEDAMEEMARIAAKAAKNITTQNTVERQARELIPNLLKGLGMNFEFIPNPQDDPLAPTEEDRKKAQAIVDEVSKVRE